MEDQSNRAQYRAKIGTDTDANAGSKTEEGSDLGATGSCHVNAESNTNSSVWCALGRGGKSGVEGAPDLAAPTQQHVPGQLAQLQETGSVTLDHGIGENPLTHCVQTRSRLPKMAANELMSRGTDRSVNPHRPGRAGYFFLAASAS